MVPTLGIGDVVLSERVRASDLGPGDIVTQPETLGPAEAMTHRVIGLRDVDGALTIETRGDANESAETWTVGRGELVGRVRWSVPWVGNVASGMRTSGVQLALALGVVAALVATMLRPRHGAGGRPVEPTVPA
jgi:signal peptidase